MSSDLSVFSGLKKETYYLKNLDVVTSSESSFFLSDYFYGIVEAMKVY
jgi:hypothetical protein